MGNWTDILVTLVLEDEALVSTLKDRWPTDCGLQWNPICSCIAVGAGSFKYVEEGRIAGLLNLLPWRDSAHVQVWLRHEGEAGFTEVHWHGNDGLDESKSFSLTHENNQLRAIIVRLAEQDLTDFTNEELVWIQPAIEDHRREETRHRQDVEWRNQWMPIIEKQAQDELAKSAPCAHVWRPTAGEIYALKIEPDAVIAKVGTDGRVLWPYANPDGSLAGYGPTLVATCTKCGATCG